MEESLPDDSLTCFSDKFLIPRIIQLCFQLIMKRTTSAGTCPLRWPSNFPPASSARVPEIEAEINGEINLYD